MERTTVASTLPWPRLLYTCMAHQALTMIRSIYFRVVEYFMGNLAMLSYILDEYRLAGPSAGVDAHEISELKWDSKQVREDIEELLGNREGLRSRLVAVDEKESEF